MARLAGIEPDRPTPPVLVTIAGNAEEQVEARYQGEHGHTPVHLSRKRKCKLRHVQFLDFFFFFFSHNAPTRRDADATWITSCIVPLVVIRTAARRGAVRKKYDERQVINRSGFAPTNPVQSCHCGTAVLQSSLYESALYRRHVPSAGKTAAGTDMELSEVAPLMKAHGN